MHFSVVYMRANDLDYLDVASDITFKIQHFSEGNFTLSASREVYVLIYRPRPECNAHLGECSALLYNALFTEMRPVDADA